ncbi:hypothetical protein RDI58_017854 [Solanum bulbocastanum]|uniref:Uncharacterized protein n=1 Tax=Solanum bulbocastanum TaxID=147425 RepID=A0AAN8TD35_SOLBU
MGDEVESNLPQSYENEPSEYLMRPSIPKDNGEVLLTRTDVPETIIDVPSKEFVTQQPEVEYEEEFEIESTDEFEDEYEDESENEQEDEFEDESEEEISLVVAPASLLGYCVCTTYRIILQYIQLEGKNKLNRGYFNLESPFKRKELNFLLITLGSKSHSRKVLLLQYI